MSSRHREREREREEHQIRLQRFCSHVLELKKCELMSSCGVFSLASYPKNLNIQRPGKNKNTHRHFRRASWGKKTGNSSVCCTRVAEVVFRLQFHEQKRVRQSIAAAARLTELHDL